MPRWKKGEKIMEPTDRSFGVIEEVFERAPQADNLYVVKWDDGFDDGEGNTWAEWELSDMMEEFLND